MKGLITIPLFMLTIVAIFSYVYTGSVSASDFSGSMGLPQNDTRLTGVNLTIAYWDSVGHPLLYKNGSVFGEAGELRVALGIQAIMYNCFWSWNNDTATAVGARNKFNDVPWFPAFDNPYAEDETKEEVSAHIDTAAGTQMSGTYGWFAGGQFGLVVIVSIVISVATLAGLHVFGSGVSESSVDALVKGGALLSIFIGLTAAAYNGFTMVPYGWVAYFSLTGMFTLGVINTIGHGGVD